jgi:hypothetical protein
MKYFLRTGITSIILAVLAIGGYWTYSSREQQRMIAELTAINAELEQKVEEHKAMIERLSRSRRIAHIEIVDQAIGLDSRAIETTLRLYELDDDGGEIARQDFTITGDVLFVDAWTVKFDHEKIAQGHPLYGRTLVLLRRVYSDRMAPIDGLAIDTPGAIPPGYATGDASQFEQKVWSHFWELAMDADLAKAMDVRVAQGEAVYKPVRKDQWFELLVDAAGGINLTPIAAPAPPAGG